MRIIQKIKLLIAILLLLSVPIYLYASVEEAIEPTITVTPEPIEEAVVEVEVKEPTAIEMVDFYSAEYGVNPTLAKAIIFCESGIYHSSIYEIHDYQRTQPTLVTGVVSSASGYAQFLDGTWRWTMERMGLPVTTDKHDPILSLKAFVWLLSKDGTSHWTESRACWSKYI